MAYIYQPKGRAGEYGKLALNHYKGCGHACKYCYVPSILYQAPEEFHANPKPRPMEHKQFSRELEESRGKSVFLCFTCDPYQPIEMEYKITRHIIQRFEHYGISPNILTKGGMRSVRDFDILVKNPEARYGATLTFLNRNNSLEWEPGAASPQERMEALKQAHAMGIKTWVSLEPVIDPEQSLEIIQETSAFVDEFKIGRWNYNPRANKIDWAAFIKKVVALCQRLEKNYYVKKDLIFFLN